MYFSGFNRSCKDFSPGSASLLSSTAAYLSCKDFSLRFLPLSFSTTGPQFYTNPTRLSSTLPNLLSNYQGSLNRTIDVLDILKRILYLSGFNLIGGNVSPESASLFSSATAHKCYTSSTSGFNLSCKDFSSEFLFPSSPTTGPLLYTNSTKLSPMLQTLSANYQDSSSFTTDDVDILKWTLHSSGFKFSYKDFSPSARPRTTISTLLSNYQGVLNRSIEDIDIPKRILYLNGFNMSSKDFSPGFSGDNFNCKDFSPGSALFPLLHISPTSDFNFSCKDFSLGFASLPANQFYTSSKWLSAILSTLLSNYLSGFNCKDFFPDPICILPSIAPQQFHTNGFNFCCKDFSPVPPY
jgi:hypothetical protein